MLNHFHNGNIFFSDEPEPPGMYCDGCNKHTVSFLHHPPIPECRLHPQHVKPLYTRAGRKPLYTRAGRKPLSSQSETGRKPLHIVSDGKQEQNYKKLVVTPVDNNTNIEKSLYPNNKRKPLQDHMTDHVTDSGKSLMLIIVISHPNNTEARNAIRNTWAKTRHHKEFLVRTVFLVGQTGNSAIDGASKQEAVMSQDVLVADLREDYYQLDVKSTAALTWGRTYCHNFKVSSMQMGDFSTFGPVFFSKLWQSIPILKIINTDYFRKTIGDCPIFSIGFKI